MLKYDLRRVFSICSNCCIIISGILSNQKTLLFLKQQETETVIISQLGVSDTLSLSAFLPLGSFQLLSLPLAHAVLPEL